MESSRVKASTSEGLQLVVAAFPSWLVERLAEELTVVEGH